MQQSPGGKVFMQQSPGGKVFMQQSPGSMYISHATIARWQFLGQQLPGGSSLAKNCRVEIQSQQLVFSQLVFKLPVGSY